MLRQKNSFIRSLTLGAVCCTAALATAASVRAGETDRSKEAKNVIEQPVRDPRFFVEIGGAGEFDFHATKFISNGSADFGVVGAYSLPTKIQSRNFTSAHETPAIDARGRVGYIVNPFLSVYTMFSFSHAEGDDSRRLGSITDRNGAFGAVGGRYDLYADVGQYQSYSGSLGGRLTLPRTILDLVHAPKFITPYLNFSAGGKYVESQHVRFFGDGRTPLVNTTIDLYDNSWVFTGEGGLGYELKFARNFSVNIDSNYGYDTKPSRGDRRLNGPNNSGFNGVNNSGDRFYSSFGATAVFKF